MNPFFFGTSARQLFGIYEPPARSARDHGVVLCPPLGNEYLNAHPAYRLLARQLAADGHHVLRLDYHGTGDSAGEFEDTAQTDWIADVRTAITELKDLGQISRVALVGIRIGGTLAAQEARRRDDVDRLVLWDAITDGRAYLAEIGAGAAGPDGVIDAAGVGLGADARRDLDGITLDTFRAPLPPTLVAVSAASADRQQALAARLRQQDVEVSLRHQPDVAAWLEGPIGTLSLPIATLKGVVQWLS